MTNKLTLKIVILFFIISVTSSCSYVRVKTSSGFMGPDTFVATDGKTEVRNWNGRCCYAKDVLQSLAYQSNSGEFEWSKMEDEEFRNQKLDSQCVIEKAKRERRH